jgi:hypothetical protein
LCCVLWLYQHGAKKFLLVSGRCKFVDERCGTSGKLVF